VCAASAMSALRMRCGRSAYDGLPRANARRAMRYWDAAGWISLQLQLQLICAHLGDVAGGPPVLQLRRMEAVKFARTKETAAKFRGDRMDYIPCKLYQ
jgi:hypothetical protein